MNDFVKNLQQETKKSQKKLNSIGSQVVNKNNINISDMQQMQTNLRVAKGWTDTEPMYAKDHLLNMIGEIGEVADIFKKKGIDKCMSDPKVRAMLVEELADVEMYFIEVLNRLQVSSKEFSQAYVNKHIGLMDRDFKKKWEKDIVDEGDER